MEIITSGLFVIIGLITIVGFYRLFKNVTFRHSENRYEYVTVKDEGGNYIEKVIDRTDKEPRDWEWKVSNGKNTFDTMN